MNPEKVLAKKLNKYINTNETESSILISSTWGSGKTYFIQKYITKLIESNKDINIVYFSLKGITNIQELIKSINLRLLINSTPDKKDTLASIFEQININTDELVDMINKKTLKNVYKTVSMFSDVLISSLEKYLLKELQGKYVVLFLDDLERISRKILITDLIAELSTAFIENNVKIIYIADETKLEKNNLYKQAKEKYIYRTYSFLPDKKQVFDDFSSHYIPKEDKKEELYQMFIQAFDEQQPNLRSLKFAFSLYREILDVYNGFEDLSNYNNPRDLFYSICAYAKFYCFNQTLKQKLIQSAPGSFDYLNAYLTETGGQEDLSENDYEKEVCKEFFEKYGNKQFVLYNEQFIIDYIYDGFLNIESLKEFLYKKTKDSDPLFFVSTNLYNIELSEIKQYFSEIIENLKNKQYSIQELNYLYNYFYKYLKYDDEIDTEDIINLIKNSIFYEKNAEELNRYFMAIMNNNSEIPTFLDDFSQLTDEIKTKYDEFITGTKKSQIEQLQEAVLTADSNAEIFSSIDIHKIFSLLVSNYFFADSATLPNKALNFLIYLIQRDILGIGNAYQFYTQELPYFHDILGLLHKGIRKLENRDPLKTELLNKLYDTILEAVKHIQLGK